MADHCKEFLSQTFHFSSISFNLLLAKECGVFKTLLTADTPLTSQEIAQDNNIKERYAREILGCLSSAKLVRVHDGKDGGFTYDMEQETKEFLDKGCSIEYLNFTKMLMDRYQKIKDIMQVDKPGAVRYGDTYFDGAEEIKEKTANGTSDSLVNNVPGLKEKLEAGIDVIEFGCGRALVLSILATKFPKSTFTASEVRLDLLDTIRQKFVHIPNLCFKLVDLCAAEQIVDHRYDWALSVDIIHDLPHPGTALKTIRRMLKEDGVYTFVDIAGTGSHLADVGDISAACLYSLSTFLCIPESFQQEDTEAHGACWGEDTALGFAKSAGFDTQVVHLEGKTVLFIAKPV